jgi:hypothetical protein
VPTKTIVQQPVTLAEISRVTYLLYPTGALDFDYLYQPIDDQGNPVGEKRTLGGAKTGPAAQEIRDWITSHAVIEINQAEGT